jgi:tetratricopeptide (TPR) repeat protein
MDKRLLYIVVLIICFATGCSSQRNTFVNRLYHNTTARFNAYYLAQEKIKELEENIEKDYQEDFSQVLPIFYPIDSATVEANENLINEARELAYKAIDWHKISKWVDPSYFLLGKLDYYQARFDEAANTFKYLNVNSKQNDVRHLSLIQLLRSFIDLKRFDDAAFVMDFLSKEPGISQENLQYLYKTLAYYYEVRGESDMMITALDRALENTRNKKELSRLNFIMGQLYQRAGLDAFAYDYYQQSLSGNPPYERTFFARLYSQQVAELEKSRDLRRVRSYYDDLYKDRKNTELRDVILYEKALFELNQGELEEGLRLLDLAAEEPGNNQKQKGYIYQKLAEIYLEEKKDYSNTKHYVDLALENFRETDAQYTALSMQKAILDDYVANYRLIQKNDSLLNLSQLSIEEQEAYADQYIKSEEERLLKEAEAANTAKPGNIFNDLLAFGGGPASTFYWDNAAARQKGAVEFARVWGNRPLEDHWRRSNKGFQQAPQALDSEQDSVAPVENEEEPVANIILPDKETLLQGIPRDKASQEKMHGELEEAYFNLGKLLFFDLNEPARSIEYLENLIRLYPETQRKPETYYTLYLAAEELNTNGSRYAASLKSEFPESPFTKSLNNPEGATGNEANLAAARQYRTAYQHYAEGEFESSRAVARQALDEYPLTENSERLLLLDIMISGKIDGREVYRNRLESYVQNTQNAGLLNLAGNMLTVLSGQNESDPTDVVPTVDLTDSLAVDPGSPELELDASLQDPSPYSLNLNQTHIFVLAMDPQQYADNKNITAELENFHQQYYPNRRLRTGNISFTRENTIIIISPFSNAENALSYQAEFLNSFNLDSLSDELKMSSFVISIENFQQLNKRKDIEEYKAFYQESYQ